MTLYGIYFKHIVQQTTPTSRPLTFLVSCVAARTSRRAVCRWRGPVSASPPPHGSVIRQGRLMTTLSTEIRLHWWPVECFLVNKGYARRNSTYQVQFPWRNVQDSFAYHYFQRNNRLHAFNIGPRRSSEHRRDGGAVTLTSAGTGSTLDSFFLESLLTGLGGDGCSSSALLAGVASLAGVGPDAAGPDGAADF